MSHTLAGFFAPALPCGKGAGAAFLPFGGILFVEAVIENRHH